MPACALNSFVYKISLRHLCIKDANLFLQSLQFLYVFFYYADVDVIKILTSMELVLKIDKKLEFQTVFFNLLISC